MADNDEEDEVITQLKKLLLRLVGHSMEDFLKDAQDVVALVTAVHHEDSKAVGIILDDRSCCAGHMGYLILALATLTNQVVTELCRLQDRPVEQFLTDQGIGIANMLMEMEE